MNEENTRLKDKLKEIISKNEKLEKNKEEAMKINEKLSNESSLQTTNINKIQNENENLKVKIKELTKNLENFNKIKENTKATSLSDKLCDTLSSLAKSLGVIITPVGVVWNFLKF